MTTPSTSTPEPTGEAEDRATLRAIATLLEKEGYGDLARDAMRIRSSLPTAPAAPARERIRVIVDREHNVEVEVSPILGVSLDMLTMAFAAALKRREWAAAPLPGGADLREAAEHEAFMSWWEAERKKVRDTGSFVLAEQFVFQSAKAGWMGRALSSLSPVPAAEDVRALRDKIVMVDCLIHADDCESKDKHSNRCMASGEVLDLFDRLFPSLLVPAPSNTQERK